MTAQPAKTRALLGVEFAVTDYDGALAALELLVRRGGRGYFCHTPAHGLMAARRDSAALAALAGSTMTLPDGMGVVWALRVLGEPLRDRVYGPDLMLMQCERGAAAGQRHYLYGGHDGAALARLETELRHRFPGLELAGESPPHREPSAAEDAEVAARINAFGADVVWCGIGSPRQEKWMARMRPALEAPALLGVGAAFDFISGRVAQAPAWMRRRGLEWLFRLGREPRRLGPRYLRDNPAFVTAVARQWLRERRARA